MHAVGDVADDVEVVRDEDVGEPEVALQVLEQVEDLRLHRDVERRDRLVADDQLRVDGERARDADALALAAGELVREAVVVLRVEADDLEQLLDAALDLGVGAELVHLERLGDDEADALARVQRRVRVLEDHHHLAPDRPHLRAREVRDVAPVEDDLAAGRVEQAHDAARHRRLAAAGLADDAERLALVDGEGDAVDGLDGADLLLEDDPARDREVLLQVLDDEQLVARARRLGRRRSGGLPGRGRSSRHLAGLRHHLGERASPPRGPSSPRRGGRRAGALARRTDGRSARLLRLADVHHVGTARMEAAARAAG